jgi:hypothetical protein
MSGAKLASPRKAAFLVCSEVSSRDLGADCVSGTQGLLGMALTDGPEKGVRPRNLAANL